MTTIFTNGNDSNKNLHNTLYNLDVAYLLYFFRILYYSTNIFSIMLKYQINYKINFCFGSNMKFNSPWALSISPWGPVTLRRRVPLIIQVLKTHGWKLRWRKQCHEEVRGIPARFCNGIVWKTAAGPQQQFNEQKPRRQINPPENWCSN